MIIAYLDEFGHNGPFFSWDHPRYNTSAVFGLAGIMLPEDSVRQFASLFLRRKTDLLSVEIVRSGKEPYEWEKKGTNLFTAASVERYPEVRRAGLRLLNQVSDCGGRIFYRGREKVRGRDDLNANGFYKTILADAIRSIDRYCCEINQNFIIVVDEHSARKELLVTAAKTMYGQEGARSLVSPPFEAESYLNQNIQAADWIATLVGRLWSNRLDPIGFAKYDPYQRYYWDRLHAVATHSSVWRRPVPQH